MGVRSGPARDGSPDKDAHPTRKHWSGHSVRARVSGLRDMRERWGITRWVVRTDALDVAEQVLVALRSGARRTSGSHSFTTTQQPVPQCVVLVCVSRSLTGQELNPITAADDVA